MSVTFYVKGELGKGPILNVANGNAVALLEMLGLPVDEDLVGSADPVKVLEGIAFVKSLQMAGCNPLEKETVEHKCPGQPTFVECGRTEEQVRRYMVVLKCIAERAMDKNVTVNWA